jgi:hypothetical protein
MRIVMRADGGDRHCQLEPLETLNGEQGPEDQISRHVVVKARNGGPHKRNGQANLTNK